jgi:hypothetical protein
MGLSANQNAGISSDRRNPTDSRVKTAQAVLAIDRQSSCTAACRALLYTGVDNIPALVVRAVVRDSRGESTLGMVGHVWCHVSAPNRAGRGN